MAALKAALLAAVALGCAAAGAADVITYVQTTPPAGCLSPRCDALGYPVPLPVESQTPVDGFRSLASLQARLADLDVTSADLSTREVGRTLKDRAINAYVVGDAGTLTVDGFPEPAMLLDGGLHAREWASPEVVAGLIERFMDRQADAGLYRYLLDNLTLVVIPVLNADGFAQTQRFPAQALTSQAADDPPDWPRDGRMRRKNLHDADEDLFTQADYLLGVDCNRNNAPFFGNHNQNSDDPQSLVYHGLAAGSENETQALYAAARLAPESRLRLYVDTHSFGRIFLAVDTGNVRRDALQRTLGSAMRASTANRYAYSPTPAGTGIGSTDERFAYADQVPAYTLEIEPVNGGQEYGGFGVTHDGFILPASQIARVRNELGDALTAGAYRMGGPPAVARAQIRERGTGTIVFAAHWARLDDATRRLVVDTRQPLRGDVDYTLWVAFDKPMHVRDGGGQVAQFPGQQARLAPRVSIQGADAAGAEWNVDLPADASAWRAAAGGAPAGDLRYADDAFAVNFRLPATTPLAGARRVNLAIDAADATGALLDANPATVTDFSDGAWTRYEDSGGASGDTGGVDRSLRMVDDGSALFAPATPPPTQSGGGGGGALAPGVILFLFAAALRRRRA